MKAVLTTLGRFHSFDLARQLHAQGSLEAIYTGYPRFKLKGEGLPTELVRTFPYVHAPYMASGWRDRFGIGFLRQWEYLDRTTLDRFVASALPDADVFVGLSSCGLATGRKAKRRGMRYVCDRGSTHIRHQDEVLAAEHERWGVAFVGVDPRIVSREEDEYDAADCITVPSSFVRDTFLARGVAGDKVRVLPYGVDLTRFHPVEEAPAGRFDVLFVGGLSLRKGAPYLFEAFAALEHPAKSLTIAGIPDRATMARLEELKLIGDGVTFLGHVQQTELKALMSRSHVMVLPSIEEGLAMVMAQAMASGCPVVATPNTGATDLFTDGVEGRVVPETDSAALAACLQQLADDPATLARLRGAALERVRAIGGWSDYGRRAIALYGELTSAS